jgi:hypothetical protein
MAAPRPASGSASHGHARRHLGTLIGCHRLCPRLGRPDHHGLQRRAAGLPRHPAGAGLLAVFGANQYGIIVALGIAYTPSVARIVRGTVLSLREKEFIEASRVMGNSELYTMFRHILPNCMAPITVLATSMFGWVILAESALSLPGPGRAAAGADLGQHAGRGRPLSARRLARHLPGPVHLADAARHQPAGRRGARPARSRMRGMR